MTAPGNSTLLLTLLAAFFACVGYAGGRLHQWYRMGRDRDEAYRDGYDTATRSVFSLAARVISPRRGDRSAIRASAAVVLPASAVVCEPVPSTGSSIRAAALLEPIVTQPMSPVAEPSGRHTVPDELVQADTYRLPPDRVARAKVRGARPPGGSPATDAGSGAAPAAPQVAGPRSGAGARSRPAEARPEATSRAVDARSGAAGPPSQVAGARFRAAEATSRVVEATPRPAVPKPRSS
ncbi:MAG TPA: hypothetical protein VGP57_17035 [Actinoplanes sp.]|nr:hypothetical protein [Actinoplanes sp.]